MIHPMHRNVISIRLHDVDHDMALDWLDARAYSAARFADHLREQNARLVAAFHRRSTNNNEAWVVHIFDTQDGPVCYATDLLVTASVPERSNEYGDAVRPI